MARTTRPIDAYVAQFSGPTRVTLDALVATLRQLLPEAKETISYGMPCFAVRGKAVAGFAAFKNHCAYLPHSGSVIATVPDVAHMKSTKGSLHIPLGTTLPRSVVKKLIRARLNNIAEVTNGRRYEFYDNGVLKAEGSMKNGELHGTWRWFRTDGSLMRTGSFQSGVATGEWTTVDRAGRVVRRTTRQK